MKYRFKDLVDVRRLQELTDDLYEATGIPSSIVDMDGEILTGSGWQRICTEFHRRHPEMAKQCTESDLRIRRATDEGEPFVIYRCPRGLVDASSPVIIEGEHVANVFAGQVFNEPPDEKMEQFFRQQAREFGLDEEEYIEAFREVPVFPLDRFRSSLNFLARLTELVASIGLMRKRELDTADELHAKERQFRYLIESVNMVPWELDLSTNRFTYVGPQAEKVLGRPAEYWRDFDAWAAAIHEEDRERTVHFCELETRRGTDHSFEYRIRTPDDHIRWIFNIVSVISGPAGPEKLTGFVQDITERKRVEEMLRTSEQDFRSLFNAITESVCLLDRDGVLVALNETFAARFGKSVSECIGQSVYGLIPPDVSARRKAVVEKVLKTGLPARFEDQRADIWISHSVFPILGCDGSVERLAIFAMDITERKKTEEALEASETHLRRLLDESDRSRRALLSLAEDQRAAEASLRLFKTIFDNANFGAAIADMNGVLIYINKYWATIHGYDAKDLLGENLRVLHTSQQMEQVGRLLEEMTGSGVFDAQEVGHCRKDGSEFSMLMTGTLVRDEDGTPLYFTATAIDITERKALEEQLRQAQKMESVGRLAGGVAHDFNNMLQLILGHAETALEQVNPTDPLHDDLLQIRKAAERSANLTRQLLAFARRQTVAPKVLDLNDTVDGMITMLRRLIGEHIDLVWAPGKDLWPIRMDPTQLDQILANLCVNARDAISSVGRISIETRNIVLDDEYCADYPESLPGEYVVISLSDTGCGMSKEVLEHLFEPFFTTKGLGEGTGLGLATVYGTVKQNNGFINVYSEPGHGTTFKMYLPRYVGRAASGQAEIAAGPVVRGKETVLLVEDEPAILKLGSRMLKQLGYTVLTAATPGEAIHMAEENAGEIHLLITDVVMPEMNGRDLAKRLQSLYPALKRLFMSGYTADIIAHHGVIEEGVHFMQKPFSMKGLSDKVREALEEI